MGPFDIVVITLVGAAFAAVVGVAIYRKVKGKSHGCDCGCSGCPCAGACSRNKKPKKQ